MSETLRLTIALPVEMADAVRNAVDSGAYSSTGAVVREALRDWRLKRLRQARELAALKVDIEKGLADGAAGRVLGLDADRIIERGKKFQAARSTSA